MSDQDQLVKLDSESVAAYLRQHPEFFVDHEELIPELRIPHQPGEAVSLVERQVKLLRERNIEMRHRLSQLMDVARDNDRLFDKTRRLVLDLLDAGSLEEVIGAVEDVAETEESKDATLAEKRAREAHDIIHRIAAILAMEEGRDEAGGDDDALREEPWNGKLDGETIALAEDDEE